jgi:hypothetical protein
MSDTFHGSVRRSPHVLNSPQATSKPAGVKVMLERMSIEAPSKPEHFEVSRPSWFGMMFQRALIAIGIRRGSDGGFGSWVPNPSLGG